VWLFRLLVAAGAGMMLVSWFLPWWACNVEEIGPNTIVIHPWGLEVNQLMGGFEVLMKGADMPPWFAPLMWTYLGLCIAALAAGLCLRVKELSVGRLKIKLSRVFIGGVGISYMVCAVATAVYAAVRVKDFYNLPLQGRILVDLGDPIVTYVSTSLLFGYYLTYGAAFLLVFLALLSDKITG